MHRITCRRVSKRRGELVAALLSGFAKRAYYFRVQQTELLERAPCLGEISTGQQPGKVASDLDLHDHELINDRAAPT